MHAGAQHARWVVSHPDDYYGILRVSRDANAATIRRSYYKIALKMHPDKSGTSDPDAAEAFRLVTRAYDALSDPTKRMLYDAWGARGVQEHELMPEFNLSFLKGVKIVALMAVFVVMHVAARRSLREELLEHLLKSRFAPNAGEATAKMFSSTFAREHARARRAARRAGHVLFVIFLTCLCVLGTVEALARQRASRRAAQTFASSGDCDVSPLLRSKHGFFARAKPFVYTWPSSPSSPDKGATLRVVRYGGTEEQGRCAFTRYLSQQCAHEALLSWASHQRFIGSGLHKRMHNNATKTSMAYVSPNKAAKRRYARQPWKSHYRATYTVRRRADLFTPSALCSVYWRKTGVAPAQAARYDTTQS